MLKFLRVENIAVIEKCEINFSGGFQVLTGETGAGKSVIINSLAVLCGERASKELIRSGTNVAKVEGVFDADDRIKKEIYDILGIEIEDDDIIISREISVDGKNNIRLNGSFLTLSMLKQIGHLFVSIHGQHEGAELLNKKTHVEHLDAFGGEKLKNTLEEYESIHSAFLEVSKKAESLKMDEQEKERRTDILKYQIEEIEVADLKADEETELNDRRMVLANAQKIAENAQGAYSYLYEGNETSSSAYDTIWQAIKLIEQIREYDKRLDELCSSLTDSAYVISDAARDIKQHFESMNYDPYELGNIEERLDNIFVLKRKYGNSIAEILEYLEKIRAELDEIENNDEEIRVLNEKKHKLEIKRMETGEKLTMLRKIYAKKLSECILNELCDLDMKKVVFDVDITDSDYGKNGKDNVEFMISTNPGEMPRPLAKVASGGELSRIILSIKTVLALDNKTLIFDEVDTGVSGRTAQKIAEKLCSISKGAQVICITHLPQIASFADNHFYIAKTESDDRTKTTITQLDEEGKVNEIARLLGGEKITDVTKENAKELIENAKELK